ncbi:hypothetical protein ACSSS7_008019 [Eimeria intestinalis]
MQPQPDPPKGAAPSSDMKSPNVRKRQRALRLESRAPRLVIRMSKPSDGRNFKNAKKRRAKPRTQEALRHKEITHWHGRLEAFNEVPKDAWKLARSVQRLPAEGGWTAPPALLVSPDEEEAGELSFRWGDMGYWPNLQNSKSSETAYTSRIFLSLRTRLVGEPQPGIVDRGAQVLCRTTVAENAASQALEGHAEYEPESPLELPTRIIMATVRGTTGARLGQEEEAGSNGGTSPRSAGQRL